ncbi:uncharacterized protein LOC133847494 [Drosophila sulfurigaster albostrigata]|uniref:uncharacterized protein LOC133847494 n=1 Tax=Drosophila sulfurigaster albostrigata TaxID=89887 RepID=UPI002D2192EE|nr:uncharacterized protein LOC133847494 [Drosophila sulfurigaster albostrigata]
MYLISTSKKTILSDFADLETKSTYVHANGESTDFQFSSQGRVFVEVDKKAGLAVMRIKENQQNALEIQRVRKLTIENAYSVCFAKTVSNHIAIGQSSGYVKTFNFRTAELIHRYPANASRSSVLYLDYNCTDEYIAAVLEDGTINICGTKTRQRIDTVTIDEHSTLARFHPRKRFHLAVASYKGAVSVYDLQSKRTIFHLSDAHSAPCRDVSMCSSQSSLLVSVGYDCNINIFDIRRNKAQSSSGRLNYTHPLSTVALSECGTYFCAGNLKGELITYDMRSTRAPLAVRAVHDGSAVTRVAFVPTPAEEQQSSSFNSSNNVTVDARPAATVEQTPSDELVRQQRDSFCDFLDTQRPRLLDRMSTRLTTNSRRDSFDWDTLMTKPIAEDGRLSICPTGSGLSSSDGSTVDTLQQTVSSGLRERNMSADAKLKQIAETDETSELHEQSVNCSVDSDKENPPMAAEIEEKRRLRMLSASRNSTPHHVASAASKASTLQLQPQQLLPKTSSNVSSVASQISDGCQYDVRKELVELRESIEDRFTQLERDLKWSAEVSKFQTFTQVAQYWKQQMANTEEIRDGLGMLLRHDRFKKEFCRLKNENDMLRAEVQHLRNQLNN